MTAAISATRVAAPASATSGTATLQLHPGRSGRQARADEREHEDQQPDVASRAVGSPRASRPVTTTATSAPTVSAPGRTPPDPPASSTSVTTT